MARETAKRDPKGMIAVAKPNVRLRLVALPTEHGGWGMLGAPLLLGLLVAPSVAGAWLALFGIGSFLTRQPMRLTLADMRRHKWYPRTGWAAFFTIFYGFLALSGLLMAFATAKGPFWIPLLLMSVCGAFQFSHDLDGKGRAFWPEALGAFALALLASSVALAAGRDWRLASILAVVVAAQEIPSILYASARLKKARNQPWSAAPALWAHTVSSLAIGALFLAGVVGYPLFLVFLLLTLRACIGLSGLARKVPTAVVGVQELCYSLLTVLVAWMSVR